MAADSRVRMGSAHSALLSSLLGYSSSQDVSGARPGRAAEGHVGIGEYLYLLTPPHFCARLFPRLLGMC